MGVDGIDVEYYVVCVYVVYVVVGIDIDVWDFCWGIVQCVWVEEWQYYVWVVVDVLIIQGLVEVFIVVLQVYWGCYVD